MWDVLKLQAIPFEPIQRLMPKLTPRHALAISLALTALVYWIGLSGPLMFDDLDNLMPVAAWLEGRVDWVAVMFGNHSGLFGRPVSMASFMWNGAVLGPGVWGMKLCNLVIHLVNGGLVFWLFSALIRCGALTRHTDRESQWLPWLGASIWLLHPLLVSTVLYVVQRMAMLSALFTLLALIAYVYGRLALNENRRSRAMLLIGAGVPLCTLLAALSKENGILAPALCAVIELFAFQPARGAMRARLSKAFIGVALVLPALIAIVMTLAQVHLITAGYANRPFTLPERLLTQPRVLWDYVGVLLLPTASHLGLYHDDYLTSHSLFDPVTTTLAIGAWIVLVIAAWRWRRVIPGLALGVGIFLVGQALESTVFPLLMYFEHRNYLPAVGLIWAALSVIAWGIETVRRRMQQPSRIFAMAGCALILVLVAATFARATVWRSHAAILQRALTYHPDSRWLRQDLIAEAMGQQPPDFAAVRTHGEHLFASTDPSTRRLGAVELVLLDCASGATVDSAHVAAMFEGRPEPLEPDLIAVFNLLGNRVASGACSGLSSAQWADGLNALIGRSTLPADDALLRQLRQSIVPPHA